QVADHAIAAFIIANPFCWIVIVYICISFCCSHPLKKSIRLNGLLVTNRAIVNQIVLVFEDASGSLELAEMGHLCHYYDVFASVMPFLPHLVNGLNLFIV